MCEEPLQLLPVEKWADLQREFLCDWPRSVSGHTLLETQKRWLESGCDYGFKVFCPFGDVMNGMVAFNKKGESQELVIQCPKDDTTNLENALINTKLIDWQQYSCITIPFTPRHIYECLERVSQATGKFIVEVGEGEKGFVMDINRPLYDVSIPEDITFGYVLPEHIEFINSVWPHRYPDSEWYYHLLVENKCGYGLYSKKQLVSWVFISEAGNLLHLYTVEEHRRKGYAEILMKLICNEQLKKKRYVIAYGVKGNNQAFELYTKLGFVSFEPVSWYFLNTKISDS